MRAAIYARFSTDLQNDRSVEDQFALCEEYSQRQGYRIVGRYSDRARTGSTVHGRDGLWRLLDDARSAQFDVLVVEALDRLSRDQEDLAGIHKRLSFAGIEIMAVHDGRADAIQVGIRGLMSALMLTDLKHKIRRGMTGVVNDGRVAGGKAYGYRPVPGRPGQPEIYEEEAQVVRRIFAEYVQGAVPRDIAKRLNDDAIPAPRGTRWNASTLNGNEGRAYGILTNPIYAGEIVWNRVRMIRNPDTGKRVSRPNPESEWRRAEAPHLRIVDAEVWQVAQDRKTGRSKFHPKATDPRAKRLLTGLVKCGCCGGGLTMHDRRGEVVRVTCSTAKESGSCANRKRYRLDKIERAVVDHVVARLSEPESVRAWLANVQAEQKDTAKVRAKAEKAVSAAQGKLDRLQVNLIEGRIEADFFDRQVVAVRAELAAARAMLEVAPPANVVTLHPASLSMMAEHLRVLSEELPTIDPVEDRDMMDAFRSLIDRVVIHDRDEGAVACEIVGRIAPLVEQSWGGPVVAEDRSAHIPPMIWWAVAS